MFYWEIKKIPAGEKVATSSVSANYDEKVFESPNRSIIRSPNKHLSFGHVSHLYIGAQLGEAQMRAIIYEILNRFEKIEMR